ncbi:MAG: diacylglycerol/polyprenol kinase family protein [Promethearchaeota archaeon]
MKKIGFVLIIGFFTLVIIGSYIEPTRRFMATTSPDRFSFQLENVESVSIESLPPDDHLVLCYLDGDGNIHYRESFTRGFYWKEDHVILQDVGALPGNLSSNVIEVNGNYVLFVSWDAFSSDTNYSIRKAYFAAFGLPNLELIIPPRRYFDDSSNSSEYSPIFDGNKTYGYYFACLSEQDNNTCISVRYGADLDSLGPKFSIIPNNGVITSFSGVLRRTGEFLVSYSILNDGGAKILAREIHENGSITSPVILLERDGGVSSFQSLDSSISSENCLVLSFMEIGTAPANFPQVSSYLYNFSRDLDRTSIQVQQIPCENDSLYFQHVIFSNDQCFTMWIEKKEGDSDGISFVITDFEMDNRNSIYHSLLLAYIYAACGIFNLFVYLNLKPSDSKEKNKLNRAHWNTIATTLFFWFLAIFCMLPFSGFQGEELGKSYIDGFIIPPPLNIGSLIVIGFVFLFYLISTPLYDRFTPESYKEKWMRTYEKIAERDTGKSLLREVVRKIPHLVNGLLIFAFDPVGPYFMHFTDIQKYDKYNFINEGAIIFDHVLRSNNLEIGGYTLKFFFASAVIFLWILDLHMLLTKKKYFFIKDFMTFTLREKEKNSIADFVVMYLSLYMLIVMLTFNPKYKLQGTFAILAILCSLIFGDTASAFVGKFLGKHHLSSRSKKTWEGTISGTLTSFLFSCIFITWPFSLIVAAIYFIVDVITPKVPLSDNILIPMVSAVAILPFLPLLQSPLMHFYC